MRNKKSMIKDKRAFTGLEAAIVLTAFVVVAAVFSYVVLNAGFFTTQKSKEVVHTGVEQATSSAELAGDVIGHGWKYGKVNATTGDWDSTGYDSYYAWGNTTDNKTRWDNTNLTVVEFYLQLTAGEQPLALNKLTISYTDKEIHNGSLALCTNENASLGNLTMPSWNWTIVKGDSDNLLEEGELAKIIVALPDYGVTANKWFTIEVKPAKGATLTITKNAPKSIKKSQALY